MVVQIFQCVAIVGYVAIATVASLIVLTDSNLVICPWILELVVFLDLAIEAKGVS